jgi:hypothetical protein
MVRKIAALLLVLLLAGSGAALALEGATGSTLSPGDAFYNAFLDLKTSQYELTEDLLEKALLLDELADQLVDAIMSESDMNYLDELLEQLSLTEADIAALIAAYYEDNGDPNGEDPDGEDPDGEDPDGEDPNGEDPDGEDPDGEDPDGEDPEDPDEDEFGCSQRGRRLREKVADESLPEHVRANAQKALDNQVRAMEHHAWAQSGQQGPPPWSNSRHNRGGEDDEVESGDAEEDDGLENGGQENEVNNADLLEKNFGKGNKTKNNNGKPGRGCENAPGQQKKK